MKNDDSITTLKDDPFEREIVLQDLLEKNPQLIPNDEIIGYPSTTTDVSKVLPLGIQN